jgi:leucyl-tRNA synthetase
LEFSEPFSALRHQGMMLGEDGQKMSKSLGNVIDPDDLVKKYGADTVRMYLCFMAEYSQGGGPWSPTGILGIKRFLDRIWNNFSQNKFLNNVVLNKNFERLLNQTIKKVGEDIEGFRFNTAVSALMILFNEMEKSELSKETAETFIKLLAPLTPHMADELWLGVNGGKKRGSVHLEEWPKFDAKAIETGDYELVIQINGKVRDKIIISKKLDKSSVEKVVLSREIVKKFIGNGKISKIIFIPERLINIVVF